MVINISDEKLSERNVKSIVNIDVNSIEQLTEIIRLAPPNKFCKYCTA